MDTFLEPRNGVVFLFLVECISSFEPRVAFLRPKPHRDSWEKLQFFYDLSFLPHPRLLFFHLFHV